MRKFPGAGLFNKKVLMRRLPGAKSYPSVDYTANDEEGNRVSLIVVLPAKPLLAPLIDNDILVYGIP